MNKKQKILTLAALAAFLLIVFATIWQPYREISQSEYWQPGFLNQRW